MARRAACLALFAFCTALAARPLSAQCPDGTPPPCRAARGTNPAVDANVLAVLPFRTTGPSADVDWLREGIVDLLKSALDGVGDWRVADPRVLLARVRTGDPAAGVPGAVRVARSVGAAQMVVGSAVAVGAQLRLQAELYDVRQGRRLHAVQARGTLADPGPAVDSLAVGLSRFRIQQRGSPGGARLAREFLPASPEGLRAYLAAERLARASEWGPAVDSLLRVIALDSSFGPAYHRLYIINQFTGAAGARGWSNERLIRLGLRFAERLSPRQRDMLLPADAMYQGQRSEALARTEALGGTYPDDAEAAYMHGEGYYHFGLNLGEPPERALTAFERGIRLDPDLFENYIHAIELSNQAGDSARAWSLLVQARQRFPRDLVFIALETTWRVQRGENLDALLARLDQDPESRGDNRAFLTQFALRLFAHRPATAFGLADTLETLLLRASPRSERVLRLLSRSQIRVTQGRYREAWADVGEAIALDPEWMVHAVGFALRTGTRRPEAEAMLRQIGIPRSLPVALVRSGWAAWAGDSLALAVFERSIQSALPEHEAYARALRSGYRGVLALRRGDSAGARELLHRGISVKPYEFGRSCMDYLCPNGTFALLLARLELAAGRLDAARAATLDAYPALLGGSWIAEAEEVRAEIAIRQDRPAEARRALESFIALWRRADPELQPRVTAARAALARLEGR